MPYKRSLPLKHWLDARRKVIDTLASGHAHVGGIASGGPGRPLDESKPLAHAYLIVAVGQFQGFARDLHDLTITRLIDASGASGGFKSILTDGMTNGRGIDRGNATNGTMKSDFTGIGVPFDLSPYDAHWANDKGAFETLIRFRNTLAHGNQKDLDNLLVGGTVKDTVSWARSQLPVLNRYARAMDKRVWDHLSTTTRKDPW